MVEKTIYTINLSGLGRSVICRDGDIILDKLNEAKIPLSQSCGGMGSCGTCRVLVVSGEANLSSRSEVEIEMAEDRGFMEAERLSCQTKICGNIEIKIPG